MERTKDEVFTLVELKNKPRDLDATTLTLAIEEVGQAILNYCNISRVPYALRFTWANMAIDSINYQLAVEELLDDTPSADTDIEIDGGAIDSIKIGDTDISLKGGASYSAKNTALKSHHPNLDEIVMNYKDHLNKFRRMVW